MSMGIFLFLSGCTDSNTNTAAIPVYFVSKYLKYQTTFLVNKPGDFKGPYPVLYLLNGLGADVYAWASGAELQKAADDNNVLIVSATAGYNWYVDVPEDSSLWFESYILEIVDYVDSLFNTFPGREYRAISGISNGGRGAIYIASRHSDKFCSSSALSAAVYSGYMPDFNTFRDVDLLIEVGTDDNLLNECRWLHNRLRELNISHEYNEYAGGHNWGFWGKRYPYHFDFHFERIAAD